MKDGGPAFPINRDGVIFADGMSLRDYFAAAAMAALIGTYPHVSDFDGASDDTMADAINFCGWGDMMQTRCFSENEPSRKITHAECLASDAYFIADAMLKEREK